MLEEYLVHCASFMSAESFSDLKNRRRGRSTLMAFEYIVEALKNPGKYIEVVDHYDTPESNKRLLKTIYDMLEKLDLRFFEISNSSNRNRYCGYLKYEDPFPEKGFNELLKKLEKQTEREA